MNLLIGAPRAIGKFFRDAFVAGWETLDPVASFVGIPAVNKVLFFLSQGFCVWHFAFRFIWGTEEVLLFVPGRVGPIPSPLNPYSWGGTFTWFGAALVLLGSFALETLMYYLLKNNPNNEDYWIGWLIGLVLRTTLFLTRIPIGLVELWNLL